MTNLARALPAIGLKDQFEQSARKVEAQFGVSNLLARVLAARGFQEGESLQNFIEPTLQEGLPNPRELFNLKLGSEITAEAARAGHKIAVSCDFDVDGLSGGSLVCRFLRDAGCEVEVFVPNRFEEGYGLNEQLIKRVFDSGARLLITVDFGSTNHGELEYAKSLGLKTIVIDHHHVDESHGPLPADCFINPQQAQCGFAGGTLAAAGLAWYFIVGLRSTVDAAKGLDPRSYLDLACLGTICDMVPLIGANRVIAKRGLECLSYTKRAGLQALKEVARIRGEVVCSHVGFGIGPRINAAGRMVHGEIVVELLTTDDRRRAQKIAEKLNRLNLERQDTEARIKERVLNDLGQRGELPWGVVAANEDFHTGVIGIVAQRVAEQFYRPTAVLGSDNGVFKGSVRGVKGFSVIEALSNLGSYLTKYGGHTGAGGFSILPENLPRFQGAFNEFCEAAFKELPTAPVVEADTEAELGEITPQVVEELQTLAPFGVGNPGPLLLLRNLQVSNVNVMKAKHMKVTLSVGRQSLTGLLWHQAEHRDLREGNKVDVVVKPQINEFRGSSEIQGVVRAVRVVG